MEDQQSRASNEPPILQRLGEMAAVTWPAQKVLCRNLLAPSLGAAQGFVVDQRGIFLTSADALLASPKRLQYMLGWIRAVLALHECEGWESSTSSPRRTGDRTAARTFAWRASGAIPSRGQISRAWKQPWPRWIRNMLEQFLHRMSNRIIMLEAQSCRTLLRSSHPTDLREALRPHFKPLVDERPIAKRRVLQLPDGIRVPLRALRLTTQIDGPTDSEARLTEIQVDRVYTLTEQGNHTTDAIASNLRQHSPQRLRANITSWCAATPDDRAKLDQGYVPAGLNHKIPGTDVNGAPLVAITAIHPLTGETDTYGFDIDPISGGMQSLRKANASLRLIIRENPRLGGYILTAVEGNGHERTIN